MIDGTTAQAASTVADYTGELFVLGGIALAAILGWVGNVLVKRLREPTRIETLWERVDSLHKMVYGDDEKKTPGLLERMERTERRDATKGRIIRSLARQWPSGHVPRLNPDDLAELDEDTLEMGHPWRVRP
jgi:hypothetical protein